MLNSTIAYGLTFLFPAGDSVVGPCLTRNGEFSRVELDLLVELAQGSGTMIDVGANIGSIALPLRQSGPTGG